MNHNTRHTQHTGRTVTFSTARGSGLIRLINILLIVFNVFLITSCSQAPPITTPIPTPTLNELNLLLEAASEEMEAVDSYHFVEELNFEEMPIPIFTKMGYHQKPNRTHTTTTLISDGQPVRIEVVMVDDQQYVRLLHFGREWETVPEELGLLTFDKKEAIENIDLLKEVVLIGEEELEGVKVYHIHGKLPAELLAERFQELNNFVGFGEGVEGSLEANYWIGLEDNLIHQYTVKGPDISADSTTGIDTGSDINLNLTVRYSEFSNSVLIEAPELGSFSLPNLTTYELPGMFRVKVPEDWHVKGSDIPRSIAFSNNDTKHFPFLNVAPDEAILVLSEFGDPNLSSLEILETQYLPTLADDHQIVQDAEPTMVNGMEAATATYLSPQMEGINLERVTIISDQNRNLVVREITGKNSVDQFAADFNEFMESLEILSHVDAPSLPNPDLLPDDYRAYVDEDRALSFSLPQDWHNIDFLDMTLMAIPPASEALYTDSFLDTLIINTSDLYESIGNPTIPLETAFYNVFSLCVE